MSLHLSPSLLEETAAEVGPVDLRVTVHAGLLRGVEVMLAMALDAGPADISSRQQEPVGRPVGNVADAAAFDLYG
jgi:hypothetical protein